MITVKDVKAGIVAQLKELGLPIFSDDTVKGFKRPSFIVEFQNIEVNSLNKQIEMYIEVLIHYYTENDKLHNSVDMMDMQFKVPLLFNGFVKVKDRLIHVAEMESYSGDGILTHEFNLLFQQINEQNDDGKDAPYMEKLDLKIQKIESE